MKTIGAARFKEQCLSLLEKLDPEGLIITKHGKPVARLVPYGRESRNLIGSLRDKLRVHGNTFTTGVAWIADDQP